MRATRSWIGSALTAVLAMALGGCAQAGVRANIDTPVTGPPGALECPTLSQPSDSRTIGSGGGRVTAAGHTLTVPAGALGSGEERVFSIIHPARDFVVVHLSPSGQPFNVPSRLTLSYAHCEAPTRPLAVYRWTRATGWVKLDSQQDTRRMVVETDLSSLSSYALGAE